MLLICLVSAYRGFFQGQSNMTPTSVSQIFEAVTRLVVGLGLAWLVMKLTGKAYVRMQGIVLAPGETAQDYGDITLAAGGAILGVTLGSLISVVTCTTNSASRTRFSRSAAARRSRPGAR